MRRLSVLEKEQGSSYAKARHAEETLVETTKSHTQAMKKLEAKNAELSVELVSCNVFHASFPLFLLSVLPNSTVQPHFLPTSLFATCAPFNLCCS